jgi:flagellar hook-length control protein FliK
MPSDGVKDSTSESLAGAADPPNVYFLESTQQQHPGFGSDTLMQRSSSIQSHDSKPGRDSASMMTSKGSLQAASAHQSLAAQPAASSRSTRSTSTESNLNKEDFPASHKQHLMGGRQRGSPRRVVSLPVLSNSSTAAPVSPLGSQHHSRLGVTHDNPGL